MPKKPARKKKLKVDPRRPIWIGAAISAFALFGLVIPGGAMQLENRDSFCASCHTQDEERYYDRITAAAPTDLASLHEVKGQARCVDCHTGPGIVGRYIGLYAGATDLISYFSGHYPQPAALEGPLSDSNCMKCHQAVATSNDFNTHFHPLLFRWQSMDPTNAAHCVDCHASHDTTNDAGVAFLNRTKTIEVCKRCHAALTGG